MLPNIDQDLAYERMSSRKKENSKEQVTIDIDDKK